MAQATPPGVKVETQVRGATHNPIRWCDRQSLGALRDPIPPLQCRRLAQSENAMPHPKGGELAQDTAHGVKVETQVRGATHNPIRWCDRQSVGALSDPRVGHADALNVAHPAPASDTQISGRSDTSPRISHKPHSMYLRADSNTEHSNPAPPNPAHRNTACPAPRANRSDPIAQPPTHSACQTGRRRACLTAQSRDAQKRPLKENL